MQFIPELTNPETLIQQLANATKTYYNCGGHHKSAKNKEKMKEYSELLKSAGHSIPDEVTLLKIGVMNGHGAF